MSKNKKRIKALELEVATLKAQMIALNAPFVGYDLDDNYVFYPKKKLVKKEVHNVMFGLGYLLIKSGQPVRPGG